jgi:hypothetical protein
VSLATDDLFPTLAAQQFQLSVLNNPSQVEVYVDSSTQLLNSQPLAEGSTFRFYGLVFNDNGTLRMDCSQVNDGVVDTQPQGSRQSQLTKGLSEIRHGKIGRSQQITAVIVRQNQP